MNPTTSGFSGSLISMTWTPSSPGATGMSPQWDPVAGAGEFQDRMTRSPQMITSPWLPWLLNRLAQSSQLMISTGFSGSATSISRNPA